MLRHCIFGVQIYVSDELTSFTVEAQNGDLHLTKYPSRTGRWKMINLKLTERDGLSRERARERESERARGGTVRGSCTLTEARADRMLTHHAHLHNLYHSSGRTRNTAQLFKPPRLFSKSS